MPELAKPDVAQQATQPAVEAAPEEAATSAASFTSQGRVPPVAHAAPGGQHAARPSASELAFGDAPLGHDAKVLAEAKDIPNQDIVFEQLAHAAYGSIDKAKLAKWGYAEATEVTDPESSFHAVLFKPTEEALSGDSPEAKAIRAIYNGVPPPVISFRGTVDKKGFQDDTDKDGAGAFQFASNEDKVVELFAAAGGKAIVTGHSLGGALAQLAAAHYPGNTARIITFQSPGIDKADADKVKQYNKANPKDAIESTHIRADGDVVPLGGQALTPGSVYSFKSAGFEGPVDAHMSYPLARLAAARGDALDVNDGIGKGGGDRLVDVEKESSDQAKSGIMPAIGEDIRKLGGAVMGDGQIEKYVTVWNDVKAMIDSKSFSANYVLGVIADSRDLTDAEKLHMTAEAKAFLGNGPAATAPAATAQTTGN